MLEFVVINLDRRTDRWDDIKTEFSEFNLKRYPAIEHSDGWRGCSLSHINIIEEAKKNNKDYVIVLEDDTIILDKQHFNTEFHKIINYLESNLEKWDIFNMCCTYSNEGENHTVCIENIDLNIIRYQYGKTSNFMIYNKSSFDSIIGLRKTTIDINSKQESSIIDVMMCKLGLRFITRIPFLCIQKSGYSDLTNSIADYSMVYKQNEKYLTNKIK